MGDNMNNRWTTEEINYLRENYLEKADEEIAEKLKTRSAASVATKRKKMHLTKSNRKYTYKDVISEFNKANYILLSQESDYIDSATNSLKYICPKHSEKGVQTISLGHLQSGRGCYYCGRETTEAARRMDLSNDTDSKKNL